MATFLRGPSIAQLTTLLADRFEEAAPPERSAAKLAPVMQHPLTRGQLALWYIYQLPPESPAYNIGWAARIHGPLDPAPLGARLQTLLDPPASLRSPISAED